MNANQPFREQIDACRPGSDDLSLPALVGLAAAVDRDRGVAEELSRSQRFDRAVSTAMHDLPLPAGLLERLEARLAAGDSLETCDEDTPARLLGGAVSRSAVAEAESSRDAAEPRRDDEASSRAGRISRRAVW